VRLPETDRTERGGEVVRDVYAGDDASPRQHDGGTAHFRVLADADPGVIGRVAHLLALANAPPREFHMTTAADGSVEIRATMSAIAPDTCEFIRRKLAQLALVHRIEVTSSA
jgi:hypothetical protein